MLQKGVYPYEYIDDWENFNETSLPEKQDFYSHLNIEDITNVNYAHAKRVCKDSEIKKLGEYHDFYVQSDRLMLADVFENFRNMSQDTWTWSCKISFSSWINIASNFKKRPR